MTRKGSSLFALMCAAAVGCPATPAAAGPVQVVHYSCNLNGAAARMTARVETIRTGGVVAGTGGRMGVIGTGGITRVYQGELVSRTGRYTFTGRDQFADFLDRVTGDRFQVRLIAQGNQMVMIINPFGPGPSQHYCRMTR